MFRPPTTQPCYNYNIGLNRQPQIYNLIALRLLLRCTLHTVHTYMDLMYERASQRTHPTTMTSKPSSSRPTASTTTTGVRRNLFHHQLSRRPPKQEGLNAAASKSLQEPQQDDSLDIVGRDRNGNYHVEMPVLPPLDEEQAHEEEGGGGTEKDSMFSGLHPSFQVGDLSC